MIGQCYCEGASFSRLLKAQHLKSTTSPAVVLTCSHAGFADGASGSRPSRSVHVGLPTRAAKPQARRRVPPAPSGRQASQPPPFFTRSSRCRRCCARIHALPPPTTRPSPVGDPRSRGVPPAPPPPGPPREAVRRRRRGGNHADVGRCCFFALTTGIGHTRGPHHWHFFRFGFTSSRRSATCAGHPPPRTPRAASSGRRKPQHRAHSRGQEPAAARQNPPTPRALALKSARCCSACSPMLSSCRASSSVSASSCGGRKRIRVG